MRHLFAVVALVFAAAFSTHAGAKSVYFDAALDAVQANDGAGTGSGGSGMATGIEYDSRTRMLSWNLSWQNLESQAVVAHIHGPAAPDTSGPPLITLDIQGSSATGSAQLTREQINYLFDGLLYINIHT